MHIEHIALYVTDLEKTREFFETYLGGHANAGYRNPRTISDGYYESCIAVIEGNLIELTV